MRIDLGEAYRTLLGHFRHEIGHCGTWLPLSYALNQMSRSLGRENLCPFVLAPRVVEKLEYVDGLIRQGRESRRGAAGPA